jgi:hypothetical protein
MNNTQTAPHDKFNKQAYDLLHRMSERESIISNSDLLLFIKFVIV